MSQPQAFQFDPPHASDRVSMVEMHYHRQLQDALRVSLEEAQDKPQGPPPASDKVLALPPFDGEVNAFGG